MESARTPVVVGVLLAAGAGRRYGKPKVLVEGWLPAAVTALRDGGCDHVVVVLGAAVTSVPAGAIAVTAPHWHAGLSESVRAGLDQAARLHAEYAVLHVIDTPDVDAAVVARVVKRALTSPNGLARAVFGNRPGHPVVIARRHWPGGAREAVRRPGGRRVPAQRGRRRQRRMCRPGQRSGPRRAALERNENSQAGPSRPE